MWKQIKEPNLDPYIYQISGGKEYILDDWLGWCQAYVEQSFGWKYGYSSALACWNAGSKSTSTPPRNVFVPLYYSGYFMDGVDVGHTLIAKFNDDGSGTAWTSPRTHKSTADILKFSSLDDLNRQMRNGWSSKLVYLGWSDGVGKNKVIKEENTNMTQAEANDMRNVLRVLNSEAKGWNRSDVHSGKYDKREVEYLMGLDTKPSLAIAKYSQQAWDEGVEYRARLAKNAEDAAKLPAVIKERDELKKQLAEAQGGSFTDKDRDTINETNTMIKKIIEWFKQIFNIKGE